jgi:hypothetical protein
MAKASGLGDHLLIGGVDLSGDIGSVGKIAGGCSVLNVTGIDKSAYERLAALRTGEINFNAFFNKTAGQAHKTLSTLPTTDVIGTYVHGTAIGGTSASLVAKQVDYNPTRATDGAFTFSTSMLSNGYGLEWGQSLTAYLRTDTVATSPGTGLDTITVSTAFGLQAWLHVTAFAGTSVTVKLQDSADNSTFADITSATFTAVTVAPNAQRIAVSGTVRRYIRAVTTGTFSNAVFYCSVTRNATQINF